jgi:pimeloyl-ACP methyl ester carboxylesterase
MGLSPPTASGTSVPDQGERILAALSSKGSDRRFVVVGSSAGGLISLYLAREHPERVVGVVLVDALGPEAVRQLSPQLARLSASARRAVWAARFGLLDALNPLGLPEGDACLTYRPEVMAATSQLLSSLPGSARLMSDVPPMRETMPLIVLRHDRVGDLVASAATVEEQAAIEPTWIALQTDLASQSMVGQVRVVEGSGHLIAHERPDAVIRAVQDVLDMAAQPSASAVLR